MRIISLLVVVSLMSCTKAPDIPEFDESEKKPGGTMTTARVSERSYIYPGPNLSGKDKLDFWTGFSLFRDPWVIAPSSTKDRDGLGPLFSTRSCISCHLAGARGDQALEGISKPSALVVRLGPSSKNESYEDPKYGGQIQPRTFPISHPSITSELKGEAKLSLRYIQVRGQYADGEIYTLRRPIFSLIEKAFGEFAAQSVPSYRLAPAVYGMGLLDAIDEQDLIDLEDIDDFNNDGISASYNRVINVKTKTKQIGRFGHKGKHPTLEQQVAAAFRDDIGITNTLFPKESCMPHQTACKQASLMGGHQTVEIPDKLFKLVDRFSAGLGVPPARELASKQVQAGRALFYRAGCDSCHTPSYTTDKNYPNQALANQKIWPYSDLALHDMGPDLGDAMWEGAAQPREWRTPPLWGIGLRDKYQKNAVFLHDGRAQSITEAILWHGGEGEAAKDVFVHFSQSERQDLIAFLKAI